MFGGTNWFKRSNSSSTQKFDFISKNILTDWEICTTCNCEYTWTKEKFKDIHSLNFIQNANFVHVLRCNTIFGRL